MSQHTQYAEVTTQWVVNTVTFNYAGLIFINVEGIMSILSTCLSRCSLLPVVSTCDYIHRSRHGRFDCYRETIDRRACTSSWVNLRCLCSEWCNSCINATKIQYSWHCVGLHQSVAITPLSGSAIFMATLAFLGKVQWVYRQSVVCLPAWTVFSTTVSCCLWSGYRQGSKAHSSAIPCSYCL